MTTKISGNANISLLLPHDVVWYSKAIGEPFPLFDHLAGVPTPPTDNPDFRFIKLTAGDVYNSGVLTGESVTGSAPLVVATAVVALPDSPLDGETIHLVNTERRVLRAGDSGVIQNHATEAHTHNLSPLFGLYAYGGDGGARIQTGSGFETNLGTKSTGTFGSGNETRMKNIGATYYMRVK